MAGYPADVELVNEASKRAVTEILDILDALQSMNVGSNGETFGTEHMSREDRILMFEDDVRSGALDCLYTINPKFAERYVKAYNRDVRESPQMQPVPTRDLMNGEVV